jgi:hypothetical protein
MTTSSTDNPRQAPPQREPNVTSPTHNPLLDFRLAYLRAIACSWSDERVRHDLLSNPRGRKKDIQHVLKSFGLPLHWPKLAIYHHK